jgi:hypothetical protein
MSETFEFDNLLAGCEKDNVQRPATVRVYEAFSRGAILGRLTATGKWQEAQFSNLSNFSDVGIAVEAIDTSAGVEAKTTVYVEGEFNENAVQFFYTNTADDWREALAGHGIYLRKAVTTAGV